MFDLKQRRIELGLTMLDVAKLVGVSEATISRYESGNIKNMRKDRIKKYAEALQVSPSDFLDIDTKNDTSPTEADIKFALFDGTEGVTDEMYDEVKRFAKYIKEQKEKK